MYFCPQDDEQKEIHIYCNEDIAVQNGIQVQVGPPALDDLVHMKLLYKQGYHKAVIIRRELVHDFLTILHFRNIEPQHEQDDRPLREPTPWPAEQPLQTNITKPFVTNSFDRPQPAHVLTCDCQELQQFFNAQPIDLVQDITPYEVPDFIQTAIYKCRPLARHDRLVIYTDDLRRAGRGTVHPYGLTFMT